MLNPCQSARLWMFNETVRGTITGYHLAWQNLAWRPTDGLQHQPCSTNASCNAAFNKTPRLSMSPGSLLFRHIMSQAWSYASCLCLSYHVNLTVNGLIDSGFPTSNIKKEWPLSPVSCPSRQFHNILLDQIFWQHAVLTKPLEMIEMLQWVQMRGFHALHMCWHLVPSISITEDIAKHGRSIFWFTMLKPTLDKPWHHTYAWTDQLESFLAFDGPTSHCRYCQDKCISNALWNFQSCHINQVSIITNVAHLPQTGQPPWPFLARIPYRDLNNGALKPPHQPREGLLPTQCTFSISLSPLDSTLNRFGNPIVEIMFQFLILIPGGLGFTATFSPDPPSGTNFQYHSQLNCQD